MKAYKYNIKGMNGSSMWPETNYSPPLPPKARRMPGRPSTKRKRDAVEDQGMHKVSKVGKKGKCSVCKQMGHNKSTCRMSTIERGNSGRNRRQNRQRNQGMGQENGNMQGATEERATQMEPDQVQMDLAEQLYQMEADQVHMQANEEPHDQIDLTPPVGVDLTPAPPEVEHAQPPSVAQPQVQVPNGEQPPPVATQMEPDQVQMDLAEQLYQMEADQVHMQANEEPQDQIDLTPPVGVDLTPAPPEVEHAQPPPVAQPFQMVNNLKCRFQMVNNLHLLHHLLRQGGPHQPLGPFCRLSGERSLREF